MKIIFLDIDGPVISSGCYGIDPMCSFKRSVMNTNAIGYLNFLCKFTDAKIVTNSSHNPEKTNRYKLDMETMNPVVSHTVDLKDDLIKHGVKKEYFHESWKTNFPDPNNYYGGQEERLTAIIEWQKYNGNCNWVCFDDILFTKDERLILVEFEHGITYNNANKAYKMLNFTDLSMPIMR